MESGDIKTVKVHLAACDAIIKPRLYCIRLLYEVDHRAPTGIPYARWVEVQQVHSHSMWRDPTSVLVEITGQIILRYDERNHDGGKRHGRVSELTR